MLCDNNRADTVDPSVLTVVALCYTLLTFCTAGCAGEGV
jgi:hypothetical protein